MTDNGFPKKFRLLSAEDFKFLRTGSKSMTTPWMRAYSKTSRNSQKETRIGISVSRKVGRANLRNRLKRLIREYFRVSNYKYLSKDILVIVSPRLCKKITRLKDAENALIESFGKILKNLSE